MSSDQMPAAADRYRVMRQWHRPRRRRMIVVLAIVAVLVYLAVAALYASSGRVGAGDTLPAPDAGGVSVLVVPQTINAVNETVSLQLSFEFSDELLTPNSVLLADDVTIILAGPDGGTEPLTFSKGTFPGNRTVDVYFTGDIENWPFDVYSANFFAAAFVAKDGSSTAVPTKAAVNGYLPGWNVTKVVTNTNLLADLDPAGTEAQPTPAPDSSSPPVSVVTISAERSWSTMAFGFLLLSLMIVIAVLVLFVTISVYRGTRKVETTYMSWIGAMLFATIPLRGFLPGSPPIGAWIDYLIVLWVFVALVLGLVIYVAAWMRWGQPADQLVAEARRSNAPAPVAPLGSEPESESEPDRELSVEPDPVALRSQTSDPPQ